MQSKEEEFRTIKKMIEEIEKRSCLYIRVKNAPKDGVDNAWQEIATKIGKSG